MNGPGSSEGKAVLLTIQNSKKPDQVITVVMDPSNRHFETRGLNALFGVKEIQFETDDPLQVVQAYAQVLSFLFETMSAAQDLNLPYTYQNEFEFGNQKYTLYEEGAYRVLRVVP